MKSVIFIFVFEGFIRKHRVNLIDQEITTSLFGYIGEKCNKLKCKTIIVGGYRNHVHVLCSLYRPLSQSNLVKEIKANSSKWMKTQANKYAQFYWQDGFAIFSVSQSQSKTVIKYIENQSYHHSKKTFEEEYIELLELHNLEYDLKYIWD